MNIYFLTWRGWGGGGGGAGAGGGGKTQLPPVSAPGEYTYWLRFEILCYNVHLYIPLIVWTYCGCKFAICQFDGGRGIGFDIGYNFEV